MDALEEALRPRGCRILGHPCLGSLTDGVVRSVEIPRSQSAENRGLLPLDGHVKMAQRIDFGVVVSCVCWFERVEAILFVRFQAGWPVSL